MNRRKKARAALQFARKAAREKRLIIEELPGRGKGSHRSYVVRDPDGKEVGRFGLTDHSRDVSWTVLQRLEDGLAHLFGEKWMES